MTTVDLFRNEFSWEILKIDLSKNIKININFKGLKIHKKDFKTVISRKVIDFVDILKLIYRNF